MAVNNPAARPTCGREGRRGQSGDNNPNCFAGKGTRARNRGVYEFPGKDKGKSQELLRRAFVSFKMKWHLVVKTSFAIGPGPIRS